LKARHTLARLIAMLPLNSVRVFAYRSLLGYRIEDARIGWRCVIDVSGADLVGCSIAPHNKFEGPMTIRIGKGTSILGHNLFHCGVWTLTVPPALGAYPRRLEIGENVQITFRHHFDVAGTIVVGSRSIIAGTGSQFWTHGASNTEHSIHIGEDCYVGSHTICGPGAALPDHVMVALGSVVARRFRRSHVVIGGVPAETLREDFDWRTQQAVAGPGEPAAD
jgi:acetyltransferase-like isoleucine patch superfamily enzyme